MPRVVYSTSPSTPVDILILEPFDRVPAARTRLLVADVLIGRQVFGVLARGKPTTHGKGCESFRHKKAARFVLIVFDDARCPVSKAPVHALDPRSAGSMVCESPKKSCSVLHPVPCCPPSLVAVIILRLAGQCQSGRTVQGLFRSPGSNGVYRRTGES